MARHCYKKARNVQILTCYMAVYYGVIACWYEMLHELTVGVIKKHYKKNVDFLVVFF